MTSLILFLTLTLGIFNIGSDTVTNDGEDPNNAPIVVQEIIGGIGGQGQSNP